MSIRYSAAIAVGSLLAALVVYATLMVVRPPTGLAAPTSVFEVEAGVSLAVSVLLVLLAAPIRIFLGPRLGMVHRLLDRRIELPTAVRIVGFLAAIVGTLVFAFWATADVLGGYNGYRWSFATHPYLRTIYDTVGLNRLGSWDAGSEASFFFAIAVLGFIALRANHGIGVALKDALTLFAAPALVAFELALWFFAPGDMTWHVIDSLWIGGVNDLGWRSFDGPGNGTFIFSNWFTLLAAVLFLASRLPLLGAPSRVLWRRYLPIPYGSKSPRFKRVDSQ